MNSFPPRTRPAFRTLVTAWLGLAMATLVSSGCSRSPRLVLHNRSAVSVEHLVVSGTGFTRDLGDLAPGATVDMTLSPTGDSALRFTFDVAGKRVAPEPVGYVERTGGYRIEAEITPEHGIRLVGGAMPTAVGRESR